MFQLLRVAIIGILAVASLTVAAQTFTPTTKPVEIVVPYPPGGATDKWARVLSEMLVNHGWQSVVVNRPGGDTIIGTNHVAQARPDGHTLLLGGNAMLGLDINTDKAFAPVAPLGAGTLVLAVNNDVPVNNYQEFKTYVKKNPEKFNLGFFNLYMGELFYEWARKEKLPRPNVVMYKGSGPMVVDLMGGHVPFTIDTYTAVAQNFNAGKLKVIATVDLQGPAIVRRDRPDVKVPSLAATNPLLDIGIWYGLYAPAGTPKEVVDQINAVVNQGLKDPAQTKAIEQLHIYNFGGRPEEQKKVETKTFNALNTVIKNNSK